MNTALHASPPTESTHRAPHERDLSIQLPREEELRNLSLAQRLALRVALHLIVRAESRPDAAQRAREEHLAQVRAAHLLRSYGLGQRVL